MMFARSKYGARRTTVDGIVFDSTKESRRYGELKILQVAGKIADLELQPIFAIVVQEAWRVGPPLPGRVVGHYTADFRYIDNDTGEVVIEDVKSPGTRTTDYRLRKRLIEAIHGITIREV